MSTKTSPRGLDLSPKEMGRAYRMYAPRKRSATSAVLSFHGGNFVEGSVVLLVGCHFRQDADRGVSLPVLRLLLELLWCCFGEKALENLDVELVELSAHVSLQDYKE